MHIRYLSINYLFSLSLSSICISHLSSIILPSPFSSSFSSCCSSSSFLFFPWFLLQSHSVWSMALSSSLQHLRGRSLSSSQQSLLGKSLRTVQLKRHVSKVGSVRTEGSFADLYALVYLTIQTHGIPPWCSFNAASLAARGLGLLLLTAVPHFPIQATHSTDGQQANYPQNTLPRTLMEHVTWWSLREPNCRDMDYPFTVLQFPKGIQRKNLG